ncbi:MAG: hypothetical protein AAF721_08725 [Myxococcota bacterium]
MGRCTKQCALGLAAFAAATIASSTGCLGGFIAGQIIDEAVDQAVCSDLGDARRTAHLDLVITQPAMLDVDWDGPPKAASCDSNAGLGGSDGAVVFFDAMDGDLVVGIGLGEDGEPLEGEDVPTSLLISGTDDEQAVLWWAGLECETDVTTYEDLGNGFAFVEGHGECFTTPDEPEEGEPREEPELAAEYSFGNVVLIDLWAAATRCC